MSAFDDAARRILEDLARQAAIANAYGVETDARIFYRDLHYEGERQDGAIYTDLTGDRRPQDLRLMFRALCANEIEV